MFGASNDVFSDMFYNYLSDGAILMHISIKSVLKKFMIIWPKKKVPEEEDDSHHNSKKKTIQDFYFKQAEEK